MANVMLLYKQIVALSRDAHMKYRLKPVSEYPFASETNWMPLAGVEFYHAARYYPIVFVNENDEYSPIVMLGLETGHNEFVDRDRQWKRDTYIPAFVRRYPFVLADTGSGSKDLTVCLDPTYSGWNETEGRPLFNDDGTNSDFLNESLQFMNGFTSEMRRTTEFAKELNGLNLLIKRSADIRSPDGQSFQVQDMYMVNEEAMKKLSGADLEKLNASGTLGWVYAHLMSMANLPLLFEMHRKRKAAEQSGI